MLRIATRRSALARAQAFQTGVLVTERTGEPFELVPLATTGDRQPHRSVDSFDAKGLFVDTVRQALLDGDADLAVHSHKDLPSDPADGLTIGAVPARTDARDVLISRDGYALATLPPMATVGTSSERRRLQLLRAKPSLQVLAIRGNLDTRLRKVADGEYDAVVVAMAGLRRLYTPEDAGGVGPLRLPLTAAPLEPGECLPAPAQGALAVECRSADEQALAACKAIDDQPSRRTVEAERAFMGAAGGGCLAAVGALCRQIDAATLELAGLVGDPGRRRLLRQSLRAPWDRGGELGRELARRITEALDG